MITKAGFLYLIFFFFTSCGLRVTNYVSDNVLAGSWQLDEIVCVDETRTTELEVYALDSTVTAQIDFSASTFSYSVSASDCNTSAIGRYSTEFENDFTDVLDMASVTVSSESCDVDLTDSGDNSVGTTSIDFDLYAPEAVDLVWEVEELESGTTVLRLDFFSLFNGSSDGDGCGGTPCTCVLEFNKI